jgi:hypothetical protein
VATKVQRPQPPRNRATVPTPLLAERLGKRQLFPEDNAQMKRDCHSGRIDPQRPGALGKNQTDQNQKYAYLHMISAEPVWARLNQVHNHAAAAWGRIRDGECENGLLCQLVIEDAGELRNAVFRTAPHDRVRYPLSTV